MTANKIHRLSEVVVNRIAAGEVVDRPASIVRELLENAIDAKATEIFIHAAEGGCQLQVRDNGSGMGETDLENAIERHTTSKLPRDLDDRDILKHIHSFGFRGEALASIASVARLTITTRQSGTDGGIELKVHFGKKEKIIPCAAPQGTIIQVDDLFHALPARRKFLKSPRYELSLIVDVVKRLALSQPAIKFELSGTSARPIIFPASKEESVRIKQIIGKNFLENSTPMAGEYRGIQVRGVLGLPTYHRPNTSEQFIFVNARPVRDRVLAGSIRAAYFDVLFRNRHPALVLFLTLPHGEVDINVHPAKSEVRFRDAASVRLLVVGAMKKALAMGGNKTAPSHSDKAMAALERAAGQDQSLAPVAPLPASDDGKQAATHALAPSNKAPLAPRSMLDKLEEGRPEPALLTPTQGAPENEKQTLNPPRLGVPKGQLHKTYIVSQTEDAIIITDQHAAHERILHERLKEGFKNKNLERTSLLVPEIIDLTQEQVAILTGNQETLRALGFVMEPYGAASILISEVPTLCRHSDKTDLIRVLIDDFSQEGGGGAFEQLVDRISGNIACRSSIRAGQVLSFAEMDALLRRMARTPNAGSCNHGRPTYIELKLASVEKLFHRR